MTLLQRAVIQRLREAGYTELAQNARDCWSSGAGTPFSVSHPPAGSDLAKDFFAADQQARTST
jgi:hypothetical protein